MRTLKLRLQDAFTTVAGNMKTVAVRIANQNIASIRDVDAIREAGDLFVSDAIHELTLLGKDGNTMTFKVADIEFGP